MLAAADAILVSVQRPTTFSTITAITISAITERTWHVLFETNNSTKNTSTLMDYYYHWSPSFHNASVSSSIRHVRHDLGLAAAVEISKHS
jgi:hypothetical protein